MQEFFTGLKGSPQAAPVVMMGFGLPDENLHAPNEHFHLYNFDKGFLTIVSFLKRLQGMKKADPDWYAQTSIDLLRQKLKELNWN